ncbi:hypothetical protein ABPG75_012467 [Micractinium tetrahymenae]
MVVGGRHTGLACQALLLLAALAAPLVLAQNATCPEGSTGPGCALCTSDAGCAAAGGGGTATTCSTSLAFSPASRLKSWSCALPADNAVASLLEPGSLLLQCSTRLDASATLPSAEQAAAGAPAPAGNCSISFRLASNKLEVKCAATNCTLRAGQASLVCSTTSCACASDATCGGNAAIVGLASSVSGAASLACDAAGTCNMKLSSLLDVDATCTSAECLPGGVAGASPSPPAQQPAASPQPAAVPSPVPSPSPPASVAGGVAGSGTCDPPTLWEGHSCAICKTDSACMTTAYAGAGDLAATCSRDFRLANNSMVKNWSCDVDQGTILSDKIRNLLVQCRTGLQPGGELPAAAASPPPVAPEPAGASPPPAAAASSPPPLSAAATPPPTPAPSPTLEGTIDDIIGSLNPPSLPAAAGPAASPAGGAGGRRRRMLLAETGLLDRTGEPLCSITFDADVDGKTSAVACTATQCAFNPGSPTVTCQKTACTCPGSEATCGDSPLIKSLVDSVQQSSALECPSPAGSDDASTAPRHCVLKLEGMLISELGATCQSSECLVPTSAELNATDPVPVQSNSQINTNPVIAAVPLMVLTLITLFVGSYTWSQRSMWGYRISGADVAQLEALAAKPDLGQHRVQELVFDSLTVSVPLGTKEAAAKAAALRRKALQRSATRNLSLAEAHTSGLARLLGAAKAKTKLMLPGHLLGGKDVERAGDEATERAQSAADAAASAAAADYVVGLHQPPTGSDRWYILAGCSGTLRSGQVVGVLGPSGCGKTTLLGSIAGSAIDLGSGTVLTGSVQVDGHRRRNSQVAYVPQSDVLIPSLTVQECLRYSALLRLPQDTSPLTLQVHIERVLDELGLRHIADAQAGGSGGIRGVSGGERRRVTIGMELVTDPSILVLDEPTSGLDSYTADNLMHSLKVVAGAGRVVVASLHQPSRDVFSSLDQVVLMGHGRMLYMAPPGDAEAWFERRGLPCPAGTAIAEHMLRIASDAPSIRHLLQALDQEGHAEPGSPPRAKSAASTLSPLPAGGSSYGGSEGGDGASPGSDSGFPNGCSGIGRDLSISKSPFAQPAAQAAAAQAGPPVRLAHPAQRMTSSTSSQETDADAAGADQGGGGKGAPSAAPSGRQPHRRKARYGRQLSVMFWRTLTDIVRNPALLLLHCVVALVMGLITGLTFYNSDMTNIGVQNRMGGTFFVLAFLAFTSLTTVDLLITERQVVTREVRGGYYNPSAYLLSKLTLDALLLRVLPALLYFFPFYYLAGFQTAAAFAAAYCLILVTFSCVVGAMSMSVTVASNTAGQASFAMNFLLLFSLVFTGFLVNVNSIPAWIRWVHYLSIFYYAFEAMITGELSGMVFTFQAYGSAPIPNVKGEVFLQTLGFKPGQTTTDIGVLVGIYFLMVLCALGLFYLRLPRQVTHSSHSRRRGAAGTASRLLGSGGAALGSAVRSASGRLKVATSGKEPGAAAVRADGTAGVAASGAAAAAAAAANGGNGAEAGGRRWQFWNPAPGKQGSSPVRAPAATASGEPAAAAAAPPPPVQTPLASGSGRLLVSSSMDLSNGDSRSTDLALPPLSVSATAAHQQAEAGRQKKFRQDFKAAMAAARKHRQGGEQP